MRSIRSDIAEAPPDFSSFWSRSNSSKTAAGSSIAVGPHELLDDVVLAFNPDAKKHHWGKRKLKREE